MLSNLHSSEVTLEPLENLIKKSEPSPKESKKASKKEAKKKESKKESKKKESKKASKKDSDKENLTSQVIANNVVNTAKQQESESKNQKLDPVPKIEQVAQMEIPTDKQQHELRHSDEMSLDECLEEGRELLIKFIDNRFAEVVQRLEEEAKGSMIHRLGVAAVQFFDSILSMDHEKMAVALTSMRNAAEYADGRRRKFGYINYLFTPDYDSYTDDECHAELCYAIAQLISGLLTVLEDQSVYGFVNGGLKIRTAYTSFRECSIIFKNKLSWNSSVARMHFESGKLICSFNITFVC